MLMRMHREAVHEREERWQTAVWVELRGLAGILMEGERGDHTLQPTALVHETWLRLRASRNAGDLERGAFLGLASQAMRRILTDHARRRAADKRGGDFRRTTLARTEQMPAPETWLMHVDRALSELEAEDPELARVVELRFFGGCSTDEIATVLGLSPRTVKRRWRFARAWLQHRLGEDTP